MKQVGAVTRDLLPSAYLDAVAPLRERLCELLEQQKPSELAVHPRVC